MRDDCGSEELLRYTGKKWVGKQIREMACLKSQVTGRMQVPDSQCLLRPSSILDRHVFASAYTLNLC